MAFSGHIFRISLWNKWHRKSALPSRASYWLKYIFSINICHVPWFMRYIYIHIYIYLFLHNTSRCVFFLFLLWMDKDTRTPLRPPPSPLPHLGRAVINRSYWPLDRHSDRHNVSWVQHMHTSWFLFERVNWTIMSGFTPRPNVWETLAISWTSAYPPHHISAIPSTSSVSSACPPANTGNDEHHDDVDDARSRHLVSVINVRILKFINISESVRPRLRTPRP